jgi:hypothetical protein
MDYNCVIKTIKITNEDGIWTSDEAVEFITENYNIANMKYGQVIHVWNVNESGDDFNEYYVVYDNKLMNTDGDQYFRLHYDFTKNITDICAKYPEYTFTDSLLGCCIPKELQNIESRRDSTPRPHEWSPFGTHSVFHSQEYEYQLMNGDISGDDVYILNNYDKTLGKVSVSIDWDGSAELE